MREKPEISARQIAEIIGFSTRAVEKNINRLKEKGVIRRIGPAKGGRWQVVNCGKECYENYLSKQSCVYKKSRGGGS